MTDYGTTSRATAAPETRPTRTCCRLLDFSEPVVWTCTVFGAGSLVYAILGAPTYWVVASVVLVMLGCLSTCRIRKLGTAYSLMESVDDLKLETVRLNNEVDRLETIEEEMEQATQDLQETNNRLTSDITKFEGIVGLLGDEVGGIEEARKGLLLLYDQYAKENKRYQANNTLSLFTIVDGDRNGELNEAEVARMQGYIRAAYGFELDLAKHDIDNNNAISLQEFVRIFEEQSISRAV